MNIPFVDLKAQYSAIKNELDFAIKKVIDGTAFVGGSFVKEFEKNFADYCNVEHCIGVGNGTDAIYIIIKCLGIGDGDEVITTANTFIATSEAISLSGATVVFCDVNPDTYNIAPEQIEEKITKKTKAIVPVHLYGRPAEMDKIIEIAERENLLVIEDACQAHGAKYKGQSVGTFGIASVFSFYPGKNLGAYGDGGTIVTNNDKLAEKVRMFANHGRKEKHNHEFEGINSRLDGLQAAILNVKLKHLDDWIEKKNEIAKSYNKGLANVDGIETPEIPDDSKHVFHLYIIRAAERDELRKHLRANGISTGIHYPIALPFLAAYKYLGAKLDDYPIASKYQDEILSLPIFAEMRYEQIEYVIDSIKSFYL